MLWASIALTQFPSGLSSDELGHRTVLVPTMVAAGTAIAALARPGALPAFLVLVVFVGVGSGTLGYDTVFAGLAVCLAVASVALIYATARADVSAVA